MKYSTEKTIGDQNLELLYKNAGWAHYTSDIEKLSRAVSNSLSVITAWDGDHLIGIIRAVGDGETILYIQDIIVHTDYRRQGIGKELINRLLKVYPSVRQKVLITDNTSSTQSFYKSSNFKNLTDYNIVTFGKFD